MISLIWAIPRAWPWSGDTHSPAWTWLRWAVAPWLMAESRKVLRPAQFEGRWQAGREERTTTAFPGRTLSSPWGAGDWHPLPFIPLSLFSFLLPFLPWASFCSSEPGSGRQPCKRHRPILREFIAKEAPVCVLSHSSCLTLCNSTDGSPPGSSAHGILQARILEWIATPSSRGSYRSGDQMHFSHISFTGRWVL